MIIRIILWICLISTSNFLFSQDQDFPESWEGHWEGTLEIYRWNALVDTVQMGLKIEPIDEGRWSFTILYGSGEKKQTRPYELVKVDSLEGHYKIDEKNGIRIDAYLHDQCLYERFAVAGNMLSNRICKDDQTLHYEITFGPQDAHTLSGDTILMETDTIPQVKSYQIPSIQKAQLRRH